MKKLLSLLFLVLGFTVALSAQGGPTKTHADQIAASGASTNQVLQFNGTKWVPANAATGSVTSVATTAPAAGLTISGGPITSTGTFTFALANDLLGLEGLSSTGFAVRSATDTWINRSVAAGTGISISNGDGVSGNPTITNTGDLSATNEIQNLDTALLVGNILRLSLLGDGQPFKAIDFSSFAGNGTVINIAATAPAAGFTISGGPITTTGTFTFTLANDLAAVEGLSSSGVAIRTGTDTWTTRTVTAGTGISVANGTGVSGNPTITNTGIVSVTDGTTIDHTLTSGDLTSEVKTNSIDSTHVANGKLSLNDITQYSASLGNAIVWTSNGWRPGVASPGTTLRGFAHSFSGTTLNLSSGLVDRAGSALAISAPSNLDLLEIYLNGSIQAEGASNDYTVSGSTVTFLTAAPSGSRVVVVKRTN